MADKQESKSVALEEPKIKTDDKSADLPLSTPDSIRALAEKLPERDDNQQAHKDVLTADNPHDSDKAKARVVETSPDSYATPSGYATLKVQGIANDTERGEEYARIKAQVRHGVLPDDA